RGYADFKTSSASAGRIDAKLRKLKIAFLNVEIFPPQTAVLYVNGKQVRLNKRGIARDIHIPGATPVKIRAENPQTQTYDEIVVTVPVDRHRTIQLNPRKNS